MATQNLAGGPIEKLFSNINLEQTNNYSGLSGVLAPITLARLAGQAEITVFIAPNSERAFELFTQSRVWAGNRADRISIFSPERKSIYDHTAADPEVLEQRLLSLSRSSIGGGLIITSVECLAERFYQADHWLKSSFHLKAGDAVSRSKFLERLINLGYKRVNVVEKIGQVAVRGSIVDIYSPGMENPVRCDFFGDDLETLKYFSVSTQRTFDKLSKASIVPVFEFLIGDNLIEEIASEVRERIDNLDERHGALLERKLEHLLSHADSRDLYELRPFVEKGSSYLLDYFPNCRILAEEKSNLPESLNEFYQFQQIAYEKDQEFNPLKSQEFYYHSPETVVLRLEEHKVINFSRFGSENNPAFSTFETHSPPADSSRETLINELRSLISENWAIGILINDSNRFHNLKGLLGDRKVPIHSSSNPLGLKYASVRFVQGPGRKGFKDYSSKVCILTEEDIYLGQAKDSGRKKTASQQQILSVSQMVPGDIVVHADHGVAEFRGIQTMTAAGNTREYLLLQYAGSDKLYVPTDQVHKVSRYIGMEGTSPRIHSLNSKTWLNQRQRVGKNIENIARELLELYASRQASHGFACNPDCELQSKMEDKFPFVETPDQMKAIVATKEDMESEIPMDRLVCGDVGYGKTEVAMRAAFKAVCSGKQVAFLAPTTLLAFQHYQTFIKRYEGLPVSVDMVSRLRKPAEQKETIRKVKENSVDVLIGTHRLLSKDIKFADLGLLMVDEEQRFGVKHKERLKQLKASIDVLTLTATPIPRTLQMAMSGIRQISVIDTPPRDRLPVQTYVAPFDPAWVKRAIINELKRGGQIFYVFNRVDKIEQKAAFLRELVPEARIEIGHGQMSEEKVEKTMLRFINREFDILLATTIIESGLDIPNANTLIVDEAERLGLSQMYQLRGRVGRSSRQASAFFFYSGRKRLTKEAQERLETIEEHTSLGSGFKIALRDLQIRGAGNILGAAQSGHIASIGFTLYMELLEEAVAKLKSGKSYRRKTETAIEIPITALFPQTYIADEETRVDLYARLSRCNELDAVALIRSECEDRFGNLPEESNGLFMISKLRILASKAGVGKVSKVISRLRFEFDANSLPDMGGLLASGKSFVSRLSLNPEDKNAIQIYFASEAANDLFEEAEEFLTTIIDLKNNSMENDLEQN